MRGAFSQSLYFILLLTAVLLGAAGCYDMHEQPSFKAQEGPRLTSPDESVPIQGKEVFVQDEALINPAPRTDDSVKKGRRIYEIYCLMCHGSQGMGDGLVGKKFLPQPANLNEERIQRLSDADLYKRVTFGYGSMPSFKKRIPPDDRWDLVNYLRDFRETPFSKK
jgi:mono/diheme cytochrome c family protein